MSRAAEGVSRRAYARSRNISEATVRKYVAEGKLAQAVLPDGTLDAERADQLLASSTTRGSAQPVALVTARARRLRAQVRSLDDEVYELRRNLIRPQDATPIRVKSDLVVAGHARPMAARISSAVAGRQAEAALVVLRDAVIEVLEAISSEPIPDRVSDREELELDETTETQLLAMRTNLQAEKMEWERELAKGRVRWIPELIEEHEEKMAISRSMLLAIPGRLAVLMEHSTVEQAQTLIEAEIEGALAVLEWS